MNRRVKLACLAAAVAAAAAGCGQSTRPTGPGTPAVALPSLATSVTTAGATWAVAVLGGSAASHNNFWQVFQRPASGGGWRLVTPPGVASNGGIMLTGSGPRSVTAGFGPSQFLTFSPLATTADGGAHWSPGILGSGLAAEPGALAADPATGRMLALLRTGLIEVSPRGGAGWTRLPGPPVSRTPAGRACGLRELSGVAFSPAGLPMAAGVCARSGSAGIFTLTGGTWRPAGPVLPATMSHQPVTVLRLASDGAGLAALLAAGAGQQAVLVAAWLASGQSTWRLSAPLRPGAPVRSVSVGSGGPVGVILASGRAHLIAGPTGQWQALPPLPAATQALAPGSGGQADALAAHGSLLTDWHTTQGSAAWKRVQTIKVPVVYGSSG